MSAKHCSGSCHCGAVRFEVDLDPSQGTIRCNCSICTKARARSGPDLPFLQDLRRAHPCHRRG